jgi:hypothetical protein
VIDKKEKQQRREKVYIPAFRAIDTGGVMEVLINEFEFKSTFL